MCCIIVLCVDFIQSCSMMRKEGDISFNGAPPNKNMKRSMGFVMQVWLSCIQKRNRCPSSGLH